MSPYQAAVKILSRAYLGGKNIPAKVHDKGLRAVVYLDGLSMDVLSRIIVLAHDDGAVVDVAPSGPRRVAVSFFVRASNRPTMEKAIVDARRELP